MAIKPISKTCYRNLLRLARAYARVAEVNMSTVSRKAHSDPNFFKDISEGRISVTLRKYDETIRWFEKNWPEGSKIPDIKSFEA